MSGKRASVSVALITEDNPLKAFNSFSSELSGALQRHNMFIERVEDGRILSGSSSIGHVKSWKPGKRIVVEMLTAPWKEQGASEFCVSFYPLKGGTRITIDIRGIGGLLERDDAEVMGWFVRTTGIRMLESLSTDAFTEWYMDRKARRPSGENALSEYRDPLYHRPGFLAFLDELKLTPGDNLLDIGCGGGAFLKEALKSGCRATGLDHSPEQLRSAESENTRQMLDGSLSIIVADAGSLPIADDTFTCASIFAVFDFLRSPVLALSEVRRVLTPGGRVIASVSSPSLKGTPASPEPFASRLRFYEKNEVLSFARKAGFERAYLLSPDMSEYAVKAGIPGDMLEIFKGTDGVYFLLCVK